MRNLAVLFAVLTHPFYKFSVLKITKSMCDYTVLRDCFLSFAFDFVIIIVIVNIVVVHSLSRVQLFVTPMDCSLPGFPVLHHLLELDQTYVH